MIAPFSVPGVPVAVEQVTQRALGVGARVLIDGHCPCCRRAEPPVRTIQVGNVGGPYEYTLGEDAELIAALRDAGFAPSTAIEGRWDWVALAAEVQA